MDRSRQQLRSWKGHPHLSHPPSHRQALNVRGVPVWGSRDGWWARPAGSGRRASTKDMSLQVSWVDNGGREVLELHRRLVAVEEVHTACDGEGTGLHPGSSSAASTLPPHPSPDPATLHAPRFCRNSDLTPICSSWFSNRTPLFLHTNLGGVVGAQDARGPAPTTHPQAWFARHSLVQQLIGFWDGRPDVLGAWAGGGGRQGVRGRGPGKSNKP